MIHTRLSDSADFEHIEKIMSRSISTNRTQASWFGNDMRACLAFDDEKLIGLIPIEKRELKISADSAVSVYWISGAHVDEGYRSKGIGAQLDARIRELSRNDVEAMCVYRGNENSPAYKWYTRLGYQKLQSILSFQKEITEKRSQSIEYRTFVGKDEVQAIENQISDCYSSVMAPFGGVPKRKLNFWSTIEDTHYYSAHYSYAIIAIEEQGVVSAYALCGKTSLKDNVERIDMLEFVVADDEGRIQTLLDAVVDYAEKQTVEIVRTQLAASDPKIDVLRKRGFHCRWRTNIMAAVVDPQRSIERVFQSNTSSADTCVVSIETPKLGTFTVGSGDQTVSLFMEDDMLDRMILRRCNVREAVAEGRIVVLDGDRAVLDILARLFAFSDWRYYQIDYV